MQLLQENRSYKVQCSVSPIYQTIRLNDHRIKFEIDSGASDTFCCEATWQTLGKPILQPVSVQYLSCAESTATIEHVTATGPENSLDAACIQLCGEFPTLFESTLGCLKDFSLDIRFKPEAKPIFKKPRPVPFSILQDLNEAYEAGIKRGVWELTDFNSYGTPVVPIRKSPLPGQVKASIRVCGDYSVTVNSQLEYHRQPIPLPEDLMRKLGRGYCFSKIDLANAYNQICLSPDSQKKLALSTHKGVLLQKRLPFGIKSAPGYFQEIMEQLTQNLRGVAVYFDDILVSGDNAKDHLMNLRALFKRLEEKGLRCNREKCVFAQVSIDYLGHTLSSRGIAKGSKFDAILRRNAYTQEHFYVKIFFSICAVFILNFYLHIFRKSPSRCTSLHAKDNSGSGVKKKRHLSKRSNGYYAQRLYLRTMTHLFRWVYLVTPQNAELERYYFIALQTEASVRFSIFLKFYRRHKDATAKYRKKHYP